MSMKIQLCLSGHFVIHYTLQVSIQEIYNTESVSHQHMEIIHNQLTKERILNLESFGQRTLILNVNFPLMNVT